MDNDTLCFHLYDKYILTKQEVRILIFHHAAEQEVLLELHSDRVIGLTENQVLEARRQYGQNKLQEKKKKTNFQRFSGSV